MTKTQFFTRALAVLAAVGALAVTGPAGMPGAPQAAVAVGDCTPGSDWGTPRQDLTARVVELVNQHRASMGLSQLTVSTTLTNASIWKARHMARYVYMAHNDPAPPVARTTSERLAACGYPSTTSGWGENIAYGYATADAVMQGWLNSPGHRANIERASFRSLGVGAAASSTGRIYWAQAFGSQAGSTPPPPPPPPPATYACSNGADDDGDGKTDYPADPGCTSNTDTNEYNAAPAPPPSYACSNGADDDGDGKTDYPADPGCTSNTDTNEYNATAPPPPTTYACSNGKDDDFDGKIDYPADPGCTSATDTNEYNAFR
ncbi:MAG: CAP domain-containing protein [Gaiellaceae bacterium]